VRVSGRGLQKEAPKGKTVRAVVLSVLAVDKIMMHCSNHRSIGTIGVVLDVFGREINHDKQPVDCRWAGRSSPANVSSV